jgi:hypothetical protein
MAAFATSYIPTAASQVTRNTDAASMTGTNFSSWYRQDEGTFVASGPFVTPTTASSALMSFGSGTTAVNNECLIAAAQGNTGTRVRVLGYQGATLAVDIWPATTYANGAAINLAFAYKNNDHALSVNGAAVGTDTSGQINLNSNKLHIGQGVAGVYSRNGTIRSIRYYPARLTNAQLQALTTP